MKLFIHRKDLRTHDLPAFDYLKAGGEAATLHALILDPFLLRDDRHKEHSGIHFLRQAGRLREEYARFGATLAVYAGEPGEVLEHILTANPAVDEVVTHEDFTPYALRRDRTMLEIAKSAGVRFTSLSDLPLVRLRDFHEWTGREEGYRVFTPFYRKWREFLDMDNVSSYTIGLRDLKTAHSIALGERYRVPAEWEAIMDQGRATENPEQTLAAFADERLVDYSKSRDSFAQNATSRIGRFLNVGALSARSAYECVVAAGNHSEGWLRQLAWRDFYLYQSRMDPDFFRYESLFDLSSLDDRHFRAWAEARTGIPIIDAAMTELNETGWMPNRLRMVTAMFLTKNLGCPFVFGERYFRRKLEDYDNTLNRGGWLWSSSLGFDAAPYFRIMNPVTQSETHDPSGSYIRKWLPELAKLDDKRIHQLRPHAIVDLKTSRAAAIETYRSLLSR
ncbi:cryptochrome/photolyase family protein [Cohnella faecalis]|uniref:Deoxyribodipyrimidine photo-lyase n=1 Tax=Cohnella faecalis TaxID=2315694 RepID=A0A398CS20_9BACL|nr:deoxyribodipyrimidine photo-lyase [Cohnella faecalis]RIE04019.1 deoxyribodipyrimidine photo-lyase [Cohnella faecalis]